MTRSGHAKIVGRIKEMVNRGGENLHPKEVEDFLKTHPKVKDVQVFGVPDARMGEVPAAWVELEIGETLTPDEIKAYCRGQVFYFVV
jgi:fatty-acyl-CoA synthase